jgi:Na+-driven multidrug efflux pump
MTLTFFFGRQLVQFFIDDPEVIALGAQQFRIVSVSVVFFSVFTVLNGAFQGGGDTKPIMILNISRLWLVRVPLAYLLIFTAGWGAAGIWWAMFASNFSVAAVNIILFRTGRWKYQLNPDTI